MTQHTVGQNPLMYAGLAAIFTAVIIYMIAYTRRMRRIGNRRQAGAGSTPSENVRELRMDGAPVDAPVRPKER